MLFRPDPPGLPEACEGFRREIGQLLFVGVVFAGMTVVRRLPRALPRWSSYAAPYVIGGLSAFWMLQRIATFWR